MFPSKGESLSLKYNNKNYWMIANNVTCFYNWQENAAALFSFSVWSLKSSSKVFPTWYSIKALGQTCWGFLLSTLQFLKDTSPHPGGQASALILVHADSAFTLAPWLSFIRSTCWLLFLNYGANIQSGELREAFRCAADEPTYPSVYSFPISLCVPPCCHVPYQLISSEPSSWLRHCQLL